MNINTCADVLLSNLAPLSGYRHIFLEFEQKIFHIVFIDKDIPNSVVKRTERAQLLNLQKAQFRRMKILYAAEKIMSSNSTAVV